MPVENVVSGKFTARDIKTYARNLVADQIETLLQRHGFDEDLRCFPKEEQARILHELQKIADAFNVIGAGKLTKKKEEEPSHV